MRTRSVVLLGVAFIALLVLAPACSAGVAWDGSLVTPGTAYWTNASLLPISYYGRAALGSSDTTPTAGQLWLQATGDVELPGDGTFAPEDWSFAFYDGLPGGSGMALECWGARDLPLSPGDGAKDVTVRFVIRDPGSGDTVSSPAFPVRVMLDTHRPTSLVGAALSCRTGDPVTVTYQVDDELSPLATATMSVTDPRGKVVAMKQLGTVRTGWPSAVTWTCRLPRGVYACAILATDLAGNTVAKPGARRLTVR